MFYSLSSARSTVLRRSASVRSPGAWPTLVHELEAWFREQRAKLSKNNYTTKAMNLLSQPLRCLQPLPR